ncbi:S-locus lectin protein kinase family protein [Rhynchospora pubera]|uniref:non-specific serine/threonine protein kinase n=1 Tax=Rhynchospora pubera TaxID=906938 RepID=A0AAV8HSR5_9POAL|nr:S-locus lectin protein kinase family protein [Rhynchospora pubera]
MSHSLLSLTLPILLLLSSAAYLAQAKVDTFIYVNEGEFGWYVAEYNANFRSIPVYNSPFQMAFYNTTPGEYYLALGMGAAAHSEALIRWVWEANRGRPVGENATFSLLPDGNLVLAEADRRIVWSTGTSNKGVVGLMVLPNGNIVLYDSKKRTIWQSFDHPTDTLLVGQSLSYPKGPNKIVSRRSITDGSYGSYSLVFKPGSLTLLRNGHFPYYISSGGILGPSINTITFEAAPEPVVESAYEVRFATPGQSVMILTRPKYNATLSFLRLDVDGNLLIYTYFDPVLYGAWENTFELFSEQKGWAPGCDFPNKCGKFGVCPDEMCIACPSPVGLLGWSKNCVPPRVKGCNNKGNGRIEDYYKVAGAENYVSTYAKGEEKVKVEECRRKCTMDCKCVGFLYWEKEGKCWLTNVLGTLKKVDDLSHVIFVKYLKR